MSNNQLGVMTTDLQILSTALHSSADQLRAHRIDNCVPQTGFNQLNMAMAVVVTDVRDFLPTLADRFDWHGSNLDKVAREYEKVNTSMRELFEDLRDHYPDK